MATKTTVRTTPPISVPLKRTRAVSLGLVLALAFTCSTVGFAVGKLSTPPAASSTGFGPGGGFPAPPEGGFPGGGDFPAPPSAP